MANKGFVNPDTKIMADDPVQPYIMDAGGVTDAVGAHIADIIDDRAEEIFTDEKENTFREVKRVVGSVLPEVMANDIDQIVADDEIMDGLASRLIDYSTTEKRIGKWIDGKILYRRCFLFDNPQTADTGWTTITNIDIPNVEFKDCVILNDAYRLGHPVYIGQSDNSPSIYMPVGDNVYGAIVTYTKTTD